MHQVEPVDEQEFAADLFDVADQRFLVLFAVSMEY